MRAAIKIALWTFGIVYHALIFVAAFLVGVGAGMKRDSK
jgi:hypothetical protein